MNTLRAGRLVLEPQVAEHAHEMFQVLADRAIYEFENAPPESEGWLKNRFAKLESRGPEDGSQHWLNWVIRLPSGRLAGYVQATVMHRRFAYVAYELASAFWRQGIGTAAVSAMLAELQDSYGVATVAAVLKANNFRSRALLLKLAFADECPPNFSPVAHEADELAMYKPLCAGANAA